MFLPSVSTNVKGHEDLIIQGKNGYLYEYGNDASFSRYVEQLIKNSKLKDKMGEEAHNSVIKYSIDNVFPKIAALVE